MRTSNVAMSFLKSFVICTARWWEDKMSWYWSGSELRIVSTKSLGIGIKLSCSVHRDGSFGKRNWTHHHVWLELPGHKRQPRIFVYWRIPHNRISCDHFQSSNIYQQVTRNRFSFICWTFSYFEMWKLERTSYILCRLVQDTTHSPYSWVQNSRIEIENEVTVKKEWLYSGGYIQHGNLVIQNSSIWQSEWRKFIDGWVIATLLDYGWMYCYSKKLIS